MSPRIDFSAIPPKNLVEDAVTLIKMAKRVQIEYNSQTGLEISIGIALEAVKIVYIKEKL